MKNKLATIGAFLSITLCASERIDLSFFSPSFFYMQADGSVTTKASMTPKSPFFCIIVGEPVKNENITDNKELTNTLFAFANKLIIPAQYDLFPVDSNPTFVFFNWGDKDNQKKQKSHITELASGIKSLINHYNDATIVVIGYGHANTLINSATQQLELSKKRTKKPIDLLIQFAPRIIPNSAPDTNVIKSTIVFYSKKESTVRSSNKYDKYYSQNHFPLIMNVLLLINNKQPDEITMLSPFVAKHLFSMCQELSKGCSFFMITEMNKKGIVFHHRFHLSTMREDTHMKLLALPLDTTDDEAVQAALSSIDQKSNPLLDKCICVTKKTEQEHKDAWGNYPDTIKTMSSYQTKQTKKIAQGKTSTMPHIMNIKPSKQIKING